ncbi:AraC family ligand binding domain-containing protein [Paraliobacillus salinarum]|uniref:AraC family ligand binding domain-containing protein n=1 Tax=Paraliobacillus salinarum TaxID=1158996 RepID=UPI0015F3CA53|nr:AraC family ligand binding domain-containing protein [Paraliobacillus salinarum]
MIVNDSKIAVDSHYYIYTPSVLAEKLYLYPLSIGHFFYEPNYSLTREKFDSFLIMFIVKGTCDITNGANQFTARSGQFVLLDCYSPHSYESLESWEALWIHFDGQLARSYFQEISNQHGHVLTLEDTTTTYLHLEQIYTLFHSSSAISEANISTLITELLNDLLRGKENKLHGNHSEPVARAVKYINQNFKKNSLLKH